MPQLPAIVQEEKTPVDAREEKAELRVGRLNWLSGKMVCWRGEGHTETTPELSEDFFKEIVYSCL